MEGGDVVFMMLLGRLGFESGCGGRKALSKGIEGGNRTTAVEARDENRTKLTKTVRLIVLSRCLSMMSIKDTQVCGVAMLKTHISLVRLYSTIQAPHLRHASSRFGMR